MAFQGNAFQNSTSEGGAILGEMSLGEDSLGESLDGFQVGDEEESSSLYAHGQSQAWIETTYYQHGQSQAQIKQIYYVHGQAQGQLGGINQNYGQAQGTILQAYYGLGQAQARIPGSLLVYSQAQALITRTLLLDTFSNRTTSFGTIGTPDIGPEWTYYFNSEDIEWARVKHGELYAIDPDFDSSFLYLKSPISGSNIDITLDFETNTIFYTLEIDARVVGFTPNVYVSGGTGQNWTLGTPSGETEQAGPVFTPNTRYKVHLQVEDTTARFNVWLADQPEPSSWLITRTGATAGLSGAIAIAADSGFPYGILRIDNVSVTSFETSTIQQKMVGNAQAFIHLPYGTGQALAAISPLGKTGQAQAEIVSGVPANFQFLDTFTREIEPVEFRNLDIVGPPDIGKYTYFTVDGGGYSYNNRLEMWGTSSSDYMYLETLVDSDNVIMWMDFYQDVYVNNASFHVYVSSNSSSDYYWVYVAKNFEADGTTRLYIETSTDNFNVIIPNLVNGAPYRIVLYSVGTDFKAKAWNLNLAEPEGWTTEFSSGLFHKDYAYFEYDSNSSAGTRWVDNLTLKIDDAPVYQITGQAAAFIYNPTVKSSGQARARILATTRRHAQARAKIKAIGVNRHGQARAFIRRSVAYGQARARIKASKPRSGQALALINSIVKQQFGQAQAFIDSTIHLQHGQANALITNPSYYLVDTFTRVQALGSVGTPDIGPAWAAFLAEAANIQFAQVDGSRLFLDKDLDSYVNIFIHNNISIKNAELIAEITVPDTISPDPYIEFDLREPADISSFMYVWYQFGSGIWTLSWLGVVTTVPGYFLIEPNRTYKVRFIVLDDRVRFKVWDTAYDEPETWVIDHTNSTYPQVAGGTALYIDTQDNNNDVYVDNYIVRQAATEVAGQAAAFVVGGLTSQHGQAEAFIFQSPVVHGQSNAYIKVEGVVKHGQTQAHIEAPFRYAQAQARLKLEEEHSGQARAFIRNASRMYAQAQGVIVVGDNPKAGQAQALIHRPQGYGQARAIVYSVGPTILVQDTFTRVTSPGDLETPDVGPSYSTTIPFNNYDFVASNGSVAVLSGDEEYDWVQAIVPIDARNVTITLDVMVISTLNDWATILNLAGRVQHDTGLSGGFTDIYYDPEDAEMKLRLYGNPTTVNTTLPTISVDTWYTMKFSLNELDAKMKFWQTSDPEPGTWLLETTVTTEQDETAPSGGVYFYSDLGEAFVGTQEIHFDNFNTIGEVSPTVVETLVHGQARATIKTTYRNHAQAQAYIRLPLGHGQAQSYIKGIPRKSGQAQAVISKALGTGQAQALMAGTITYNHGQARTLIVTGGNFGIGLCRATIIKPQPSGQAQAKINAVGFVQRGNAQARILASVTKYSAGQAQAYVKGPAHGQAAALIEAAKYLVRYNGYDLPGYAQSEQLETIQEIFTPETTYEDGSLAQYMGLRNKILSLQMRVVDTDYARVKEQVRRATTMVRSGRGYKKIYIQHPFKHYLGLTERIESQKSVGESMRYMDYGVYFHVKPWLISDQVYTVSGTGTITTDDVGRTITNGGWTPGRVILSGTNVTVSGYTAAGDITGYFAVSGAVTNLVIDTDLYTATVNGENVNDIMYNSDYQMFVGPGKTTYVITGATRFELSYQDRWYL